MGDSKAKAQRRSEFPPLPEPLPIEAVDNHTHLESVIGFRGSALPAADAPDPQNDGAARGNIAETFRAAEAQLRLAKKAGINAIVQVGCEIPSERWTDQFLKHLESGSVVSRQPGGLPQPTDSADDGEAADVVGAIAIHPNEAVRHAGVYEVAKDGLEPEDRPHHQIPLADAIAEIAELAKNNKRIRAIGETGMDLFRAGPKGAEVQRQAFRDHIAIAKELDLALQIHDREAHAQVIEVLKKDGAPAKTVFHCFSGDGEMAKICAENGWYMSFAGPVTYKANDGLRAALKIAPRRLILAETDAPYLTPHPYRGQPNAPYAVNYTIRAMAEYRGVTLEAMCQTIAQNSAKVYGPWDS